ncbi:MAG: hypothetical protein ACK56I_25445, partial [bacterium]
LEHHQLAQTCVLVVVVHLAEAEAEAEAEVEANLGQEVVKAGQQQQGCQHRSNHDASSTHGVATKAQQAVAQTHGTCSLTWNQQEKQRGKWKTGLGGHAQGGTKRDL